MRPIIFSCLIVMLAAGCFSSSRKTEESRLKPPPPLSEEEFFAPERKPSAKVALFNTAEKIKRPKKKTLEVIDRSKPKNRFSTARRAGKNRNFILPTLLNPKDKSVMVLVYKGDYLVGQPGASGLQKLTIQAFYIDQYEITVEKYKAYNLAYSEKKYNGNEQCPTCPAMGVDWESANRYCRWAGKRLPSEAEWEAAARGTSNHHWPWGDNWLPKYANTLAKEDGFYKASPVGSFPLGASPFGALDMTGNVWEWVSVEAPAEKGAPAKKPGRKNLLYATKGGSWKSSPKSAKISFRHMVKPGFKNNTFGFRCAKSVKPEIK